MSRAVNVKSVRRTDRQAETEGQTDTRGGYLGQGRFTFSTESMTGQDAGAGPLLEFQVLEPQETILLRSLATFN